MKRPWLSTAAAVLAVAGSVLAAEGPFDRQVDRRLAVLSDASASARAGAAEALGLMRAFRAEPALIAHLRDDDPCVRREAAMALAWCGSRQAIDPLLAALSDPDWATRQAASAALSNLTGRNLPFDALADADIRAAQHRAWRRACRAIPPDRLPAPVRAALQRIGAVTVTASSTYKGPPDVILDGSPRTFWQTKNVPFPQWCVIDLGEIAEVAGVTIEQYGPRFVMRDAEVAVSLDGRDFRRVARRQGPSPVELTVRFEPRRARFVKIVSHTGNKTYPTTFREVTVIRRGGGNDAEPPAALDPVTAMRVAGSLGGRGASAATMDALDRLGPDSTGGTRRRLIETGMRSLGRLGDRSVVERLIAWLPSPAGARFAAGALGEIGDPRAVRPLIEAFPLHAKGLDGKNPPAVPRDDRMSFPSEDRMLETPYAFALALSRLPLTDPADLAALRAIAGFLVANLPGDHDAGILYEREVHHVLLTDLLEKAGLRQEVCETAFERLGQPRRVLRPDFAPAWPRFPAYRTATWLSAFVTDPADLPRLVHLLDHGNGWVRLNAAKALGWLGDRRAIEPLARTLASSKPEADFGYSGTFKDEEYNDPAPRWRQGVVRALGMLGATDHVALLARVLHDDRSVLEVRHAAAEALADLATPEALAVLKTAAVDHPFLSVRHVAEEAVVRHGIDPHASVSAEPVGDPAAPPERQEDARPPAVAGASGLPEAIVFIQGSNNIPNTVGTVEQADRWRQTYVVTDSGPAYRPGRNIVRLAPASPDGTVTPVTRFTNGYVADLEVSYDGKRILFARRGGAQDPWWHVYEVNADGSDLRRLTDGPYHHVGPAYLPDGRIVCSSTRLGTRDEYHGYPCNSLHVMNADGSDLHTIAANVGRDNEPAVLADGRIAFSRLEVFYSRLKTELTLHAVHPDGTQDVVLYGPERRRFWKRLDLTPRTPAHGQENGLLHRVLRMTQPQPMPDRRHVVVVTQGGLALVNLGHGGETLVPHDRTMAVTTPWPLVDGTLLCAATKRVVKRKDVDLGLYRCDPASGRLTPIYNDPSVADFEPRPLVARSRPPVLTTDTDRQGYTGRLVCASVKTSREPLVPTKGRFLRVIEGKPIMNRHSTQTNDWPVWKNHSGTLGRVLGTVPLAADGSFYVEVPADRLVHLQVLDSDRYVIGNQLVWMPVRPGETRSCVGCHEEPGTTAASTTAPQAVRVAPLRCLPDGRELRYRAKAWLKSTLPDAVETRQRTVRAVNFLAR